MSDHDVSRRNLITGVGTLVVGALSAVGMSATETTEDTTTHGTRWFTAAGGPDSLDARTVLAAAKPAPRKGDFLLNTVTGEYYEMS
jgi:hypothetical protein